MEWRGRRPVGPDLAPSCRRPPSRATRRLLQIRGEREDEGGKGGPKCAHFKRSFPHSTGPSGLYRTPVGEFVDFLLGIRSLTCIKPPGGLHGKA